MYFFYYRVKIKSGRRQGLKTWNSKCPTCCTYVRTYVCTPNNSRTNKANFFCNLFLDMPEQQNDSIRSWDISTKCFTSQIDVFPPNFDFFYFFSFSFFQLSHEQNVLTTWFFFLKHAVRCARSCGWWQNCFENKMAAHGMKNTYIFSHFTVISRTKSPINLIFFFKHAVSWARSNNWWRNCCKNKMAAAEWKILIFLPFL